MAATSSLQILLTLKDNASKGLKDTESAAGGLSSKLKVLATAAITAGGAFVSFKAIEGAISATEDLGQSIHDLNEQTGLTEEQASRILFAFKHVGMEASDAEKSLGIFSKKLKGIEDEETGVTTGGKSTAEILADIGIKATDAEGNLRPMAELLPEVADVFQDLPPGISKTGLAMQLFGRSGRDMIEFLNLGSEGLTEMGKTADKLGVTLTGENVAAIKKYTYAQRDMEQAIGGVKLQIGLALMPQLTKLTQWFIDNQPKLRAFVDDGINKIRDGLNDAAPIFRQAADDIPRVGKAIQDFGDWSIANQAALVGALTGIGLALAWSNPFFGVAAGIAAITVAIEVMRTPVEALDRPFLVLRKHILETEQAALWLVLAVETLGLSAIPVVGDKLQELLASGGFSSVAAGLLDVADKVQETQAEIDKVDVANAIVALRDLGAWTDEATKSSGSLISMTDMMNPAFGKIDASKTVDQLDDICTAAGDARAEVDLLVKSLANTAISRVREFLGQFGPQQSLVPGYEMGGVVPGAAGMPQLAIVHGGEEIIRAGGRQGSRQIVNSYNTVEMHLTVNGTTEEGVEKFKRAFNEALRRAGFGGSSISAGAFVPS